MLDFMTNTTLIFPSYWTKSRQQVGKNCQLLMKFVTSVVVEKAFLLYDLCATSHDQTHSDECPKTPNSQSAMVSFQGSFWSPSFPASLVTSVKSMKLEIMTTFAFGVPAMGVPIFVLPEPSTRWLHCCIYSGIVVLELPSIPCRIKF